jgi:dihydrofolate synthase/folylpolyglutamate synthase
VATDGERPGDDVAYGAVLARLLPARRFGVVLGLERMAALLARLGHPERRLGAVVHVAGTNGKGSTVAMIAALARAGGATVATYTSPHLSSLRERIAVDGVPISAAALVAAAEVVWRAGGDELTFFEQVTAIALVHLATVAPMVTVVEVGLGGRLDATNVLAAPVAVVTGVALDHEAVLGATLAAIAGEKAGIFKPGQRVVIGASGEAAAVPTLVAAAVAAATAEVTVVDAAAIAAVPALALAGAHQRHNAAAALAAIDHLAALGVVAPDPAARAAALAMVRHPGRFEQIATAAGPVILDGAHNPHGAAALAATLRARGERPVLVLAVSADKDVRGIVAALAPACAAVVATRYQQERAMAPEALAAVVAAAGVRVDIAPTLGEALALARRAAGDAAVLIAGSLFLVGEARVLLVGAPADPVWTSDPAATAPG